MEAVEIIRKVGLSDIYIVNSELDHKLEHGLLGS
jgi:hypothetical protein